MQRVTLDKDQQDCHPKQVPDGKWVRKPLAYREPRLNIGGLKLVVEGQGWQGGSHAPPQNIGRACPPPPGPTGSDAYGQSNNCLSMCSTY